jgi:hypothetical protein
MKYAIILFGNMTFSIFISEVSQVDCIKIANLGGNEKSSEEENPSTNFFLDLNLIKCQS